MATTYTAETRKSFPSWVIILEGVLAIILGAMFLFWPVQAVISLAFFIGVFWLVDGVMDIVSIFMDRSNWGWKLFMGVIGIMAGLFLVRTPLAGAVTLSKFYVISMAVMGIVYGAMAMFNGLRGGGFGSIAIGLVSIIMGIFLLANSWAATLAVPWIFGILSIIGGISAIIFAFRMKK